MDPENVVADEARRGGERHPEERACRIYITGGHMGLPVAPASPEGIEGLEVNSSSFRVLPPHRKADDPMAA